MTLAFTRIIQWAFHAVATFIQHVRVGHRFFNTHMAQEFLDYADGGAAFLLRVAASVPKPHEHHDNTATVLQAKKVPN